MSNTKTIKKDKGVFIVSFIQTNPYNKIKTEDMQKFADKVVPIVNDMGCEIVITDKPTVPLGKNEYIKYFEKMLKQLKQ